MVKTRFHLANVAGFDAIGPVGFETNIQRNASGQAYGVEVKP
jgi:hypothetical protein